MTTTPAGSPEADGLAVRHPHVRWDRLVSVLHSRDAVESHPEACGLLWRPLTDDMVEMVATNQEDRVEALGRRARERPGREAASVDDLFERARANLVGRVFPVVDFSCGEGRYVQMLADHDGLGASAALVPGLVRKLAGPTGAVAMPHRQKLWMASPDDAAALAELVASLYSAAGNQALSPRLWRVAADDTLHPWSPPAAP